MAQRPEIRKPTALYRTESYFKKASVAGTRGDFMYLVSGYLLRVVAATTATQIRGLLTADWTNDANNTAVSVEVDEFANYTIDASTTLVQATHVGNTYDFSDYRTVDLGGTTYNALRVVGIAADGRAIVKINR